MKTVSVVISVVMLKNFLAGLSMFANTIFHAY